MKQIKYSVIIPLYQKGATIERAIMSVLAQSYPDFELIVVDDGSTDNGAEIVASQTDDRIRFLKQPNQGVAAARNFGIENAGNEYIALLDADDEWTPDFLENITKLIDEYPNCGWYSTGVLIESNNRTREASKYLHKGIYSNFFELPKEYDVVNSSNVVIPTSVAKEVGGFPIGVKAGEDILMWIKIASKYPFAYTPELCSIYHFSEQNVYKRIHIDEKDIYFDQLCLGEGKSSRNLFVAIQALNRGLLHTIYGNKAFAKELEKKYAVIAKGLPEYTRLQKLNRYPLVILRLYFYLLSKLRLIYRTIYPKK